MEFDTYPKSTSDIAAWSKRNASTISEARIRFVQVATLSAIASTPGLMNHLAFKGGNALRFVHGNPRSTIDLDFTAEGDFPDDAEKIKDLLNSALIRIRNRLGVKARCQSIKRKPPNIERTHPTYAIKVCFQLPGDKYYQNFEDHSRLSEVIDLEISFNDHVCETILWNPWTSDRPLRICSLEDLIAEKLRAILQQVPRNRSRPQDVYDISSRWRISRAKVDLTKVSDYLRRKAAGRIEPPRKSSFDEDVKSKAKLQYEQQLGPQTREFIPFEDAWADVLELVSLLSIPD